MKNKLIIPEYIAYKTYKFSKPNSRTIISNEYRHETLLLEGLSSDMWYVNATANTTEEIKSFAKEHNLLNDLEGFIEELTLQGLLQRENIIEQLSTNDVEPLSDSAEVIELENEMKNWCYNNGFLYSLFIELTYACNLKCVHCYNPKNISNVQATFEQLKPIIDDASDLGCFRITFSGGESTLHKDFLNIIKYAKQKRMSVEIFTNGQTLYDNEELRNEILKCYPYRVGLSLYSLNSEVHDKITQVQGSCRKTMFVIKELRKNNVNVQIKNFLMNINAKDSVEVYNFGKSINTSSGADISLIPTIEGDKKTFEYEISEEDLFELFTNKESSMYVGRMIPKNISKLLNDTPCGAGIYGLSINPALEVYPCCSFSYILDNLGKTSLKNIWEKSEKLKQWQRVKNCDLKECYKYEYCKYCSYCPGMGILENGYLEKSDILCKQAKARQKALGCIK